MNYPAASDTVVISSSSSSKNNRDDDDPLTTTNMSTTAPTVDDTNTVAPSTNDHTDSVSSRLEDTLNSNPILISSPRKSTYQHQASLPRLPIPRLESTLTKFLSTVEPLLTSSQFEKTKRIVSEFQERQGPQLQQLLHEYDEECKAQKSFGSYIEEFWSDAYLAPNSSVVLNLNPFFLLEDDPDAKIAKDQVKRAASLAFNSLMFAASLKNERMKPDEFKNVTLCMDQFRSLFGSCRIPNEERDVIEVDLDSDHVVVLYRHQFYYFRALWPRNEHGEVVVAVSEEDVMEILQSIMDDGKKKNWVESVEDAIGVLTTLPRNQWARARHQLVHSSEANKVALGVIDSALFVLVLDDFCPKTVHDAAANMLHGTHVLQDDEDGNGGGGGVGDGGQLLKDNHGGNHHNKNLGSPGRKSSSSSSGGGGNGYSHDGNSANYSSTLSRNSGNAFQAGTCCNRWYDKLQIIVCSDGSAGINFEHSAIDGHTALRFASDVYAESVVQFAKSITKSIYTQEGCTIPSMVDAKVKRAATVLSSDSKGISVLDTNPKKLSFELGEKVKRQIFYAETSLGDAVNADDTHVLEFGKFGKTFIVCNQLSPDSIVQMSIVLGYYRLYGEIVCAYEPVLTKRFLHGRTEAMRSTTTMVVELCKCWMNRFSTREEKLSILHKCTRNHSRLVKEASEGMGVDRHLYALKCIAEKKSLEVPSFFRSQAWEKLNHTVLSTSNCGNPALRLFGFGPVVPDGFGVGYIIKDSSIQYSISSKHRQTKRFADSIRQILLEIGELLGPTKYHSVSCENLQSKSSSRRNSTLEYAEGWDDIYGDSVKVGENGRDITSRPSSAADMRKVPSSTSLVGLAKVSRMSLVREPSMSVGTQIPEKQ
jgi:carnitine O-acetyltransferase